MFLDYFFCHTRSCTLHSITSPCCLAKSSVDVKCVHSVSDYYQALSSIVRLDLSNFTIKQVLHEKSEITKASGLHAVRLLIYYVDWTFELSQPRNMSPPPHNIQNLLNVNIWCNNCHKHATDFMNCEIRQILRFMFQFLTSWWQRRKNWNDHQRHMNTLSWGHEYLYQIWMGIHWVHWELAFGAS